MYRNVENYNKENWCCFFVVQPKVNVRIPTQIVFEFVLINNNIIIY